MTENSSRGNEVRRGMNLEEAMEILDVVQGEDKAKIRKKYRSLMRRYHPDALGSDRPEQIRRVQQMNEAYHLLMKQEVPILRSARKRRKWEWTGTVNADAFCERNVYLHYSMDVEGESLYYQAARGKYMWDPEEEEFSLFLISLRHAAKELLEQVERRQGTFREEDTLQSDHRFQVQAKLFHLLTRQFIDPLAALRKAAKPKMIDSEGRAVYQFRAWVGAEGSGEAFRATGELKEGAPIYPKAFQGHRILVKNREGKVLGHLSFDEDYLYFCLIPLLKEKCAKVRMHVRDVKENRRGWPHKAKVDVDFYFRLEQEPPKDRTGDLNEEIRELLLAYETKLMQR